MEPNFKSLTESQIQDWPLLAANPPHFVLYGGAALALTLGHRKTEDFDFFSSHSFDSESLRSGLPFVAKTLESGKNTLIIKSNNGSKISYFGGLPMAQVKTPSVFQNISIASNEDILATKLRVILARDEPRDYIDIYHLLKSGLTLEQGLAACKAVYGRDFNLHIPIKALTYYETPELQAVPLEVQKFLTDKAIHLGNIPEITPANEQITSPFPDAKTLIRIGRESLAAEQQANSQGLSP